jgi:hypothetical protein
MMQLPVIGEDTWYRKLSSMNICPGVITRAVTLRDAN